MKQFNMIDNEFICDNCGTKVTKLKYSARDHCHNCLHSKHVDINPGDRKNKCHGDMIPVNIEKFKKSYKIIYKCSKCGAIHKNIMATDDNMNEIINLSINKNNATI